jgi:hypothetical protein
VAQLRISPNHDAVLANIALPASTDQLLTVRRVAQIAK